MLSPVFSENGFNSRIWGPHLWKVMHILSLNYPLKPTRVHVDAYFNFFKSLCTILPCATCRKEFCSMVNLPGGPLELRPEIFMQKAGDAPGSARVRVINYILALHDTVNRRLLKHGDVGKRRFVLKEPRYWVLKYAKLRAK
jgi:hypothetical protein